MRVNTKYNKTEVICSGNRRREARVSLYFFRGGWFFVMATHQWWSRLKQGDVDSNASCLDAFKLANESHEVHKKHHCHGPLADRTDQMKYVTLKLHQISYMVDFVHVSRREKRKNVPTPSSGLHFRLFIAWKLFLARKSKPKAAKANDLRHQYKLP